MLLLPPLESLRFFEAAARHQSFVGAAEELGVTPAAVAYSRAGLPSADASSPGVGRRTMPVLTSRLAG